MNRFKHRLIAGITALMLCQISLATASADLQTFQPEVVTSNHQNGKWLIVMLWASDCQICNREAHAYQDFHFEHSDNNATVLGISLDGDSGIDQAQAFVSRHNIEFPNLIGEPGAVADYYEELTSTNWVGTPSFLVFSPDGALAAKQVGAVPVEIIEQFIATHDPASQ